MARAPQHHGDTVNWMLVALDGSPRADAVLASAVALAQITRGKLVLFRAVGLPATDSQSAWAQSDCVLEEALMQDAATYLAGCAKAVPAEVYGGAGVRGGAPWQTVCTVARELGVDPVVVGAHGYGRDRQNPRLYSRQIADHVDRPLLVVRTTPTPEVE